MSRNRFIFEQLEPRRLLSVSLLADVNTVTPSSDPSAVKVAGGVGYFTATLPATGRELWRTDGTDAGTSLVAETVAGSSSLNPTLFQPVGTRMLMLTGTSAPTLWVSDGTAAGTTTIATLPSAVHASAATTNQVFYVVQGSSPELWRTDGTAAGTIKLTTLSSIDTLLTVMGGKVYFANTDSVAGMELWSSDGTAAGTARLKDIYAGTLGSFPANLASAGNTLFFTAGDAANGTELWKSDGTAAGTARVTQLGPGSASAALSKIVGGSTLAYFLFQNNVWRSDGTSAGTFVLTSLGLSDYGLITAGNKLYIGTLSGSKTASIWTSDGTQAGTALAYDVPGTGYYSLPKYMCVVGGKLFFREDTYVATDTLYCTDGTAAGSGPVISYPLVPNSGAEMADLNGIAIFPAYSYESTDAELFRSDGTPAGTTRIKDINDTAPNGSSQPLNATVVNGKAFFWATASDVNRGTMRIELFSSDGTPGGTRALLESKLIEGSSIHNSPIVEWRGQAYFMSDSAGLGRELWTSDGTPEGTHIVADISPGAAATNIDMLYPASQYLYFAATTSAYGRELWRTDGTADGTLLVKDIFPGTAGGLLPLDRSNPWSFAEWNGGLYFFAIDTSQVTHLYRTEGTDATTQVLADMSPDIYSHRPAFTVAAGHLFIAPAAGPLGTELWTTDGTPAGTVVLKDIAPGSANSSPNNFTPFAEKLFFTAGSSSTGTELWVSDGTPDGTQLFADIRPGSPSGAVNRLMATDERLFFSADDGIHGEEWWVTDGTTAGTTLLKDIVPGSGSSVSSSPTSSKSPVGNVVFFSTNSASDGMLWRSDGTADGTYSLQAPHATSVLGQADGVLYYVASDGTTGAEVWRTDGTVTGTRLLQDIYPGTTSSNPRFLLNVGGNALFVATDPLIGEEFWRATDEDAPVITSSRLEANHTTPAVTLRFNETIVPLNSDQFGLLNLDSNSAVDPAALSVTYDPGRSIEMLALASSDGKPLPNGNYRLVLPAGVVADSFNNRSNTSMTYDFSILAGDGDRDGRVDILDFNILAANFGKTAQTFSQGNYDYSADGQITLTDFNILAANFGKHLDPPAGTTQPAVQVQSASLGEIGSTATTSRWLNPQFGDTNLLSDVGLM